MKPPKTLYVAVEEEGTENEYLNSVKDPEELNFATGEEKQVFVYELKQVRKYKSEIVELKK
jgi:hypothetical protein